LCYNDPGKELYCEIRGEVMHVTSLFLPPENLTSVAKITHIASLVTSPYTHTHTHTNTHAHTFFKYSYIWIP